MRSKDCQDIESYRYSRYRVGRNKWFWVIFSNDERWFRGDPIAQGHAESARSALEDATDRVGELLQVGNSEAEWFRKKTIALERSKRFASLIRYTNVEYVFKRCEDSATQDIIPLPPLFAKHRVVRRTQSQIIVESKAYQGDGKYHSTFMLNRKSIESTGKAVRVGRNGVTYYADPAIYFAEEAALACNLFYEHRYLDWKGMERRLLEESKQAK